METSDKRVRDESPERSPGFSSYDILKFKKTGWIHLKSDNQRKSLEGQGIDFLCLEAKLIVNATTVGQGPFRKVQNVDIIAHDFMFELLNFELDPEYLFHRTRASFDDGNATRDRHRYENVVILFHFCFLRTPIPQQLCWIYPRRFDNALYGRRLNAAVKFQNQAITPVPSSFSVALCNLTNLRRQRIHVVIFYLNIALDCDTPILEALFWLWNAGDPMQPDAIDSMPTSFYRNGDELQSE
jgi:hypothetical protein